MAREEALEGLRDERPGTWSLVKFALAHGWIVVDRKTGGMLATPHLRDAAPGVQRTLHRLMNDQTPDPAASFERIRRTARRPAPRPARPRWPSRGAATGLPR